jgi:hypothetical protein
MPLAMGEVSLDMCTEVYTRIFHKMLNDVVSYIGWVVAIVMPRLHPIQIGIDRDITPHSSSCKSDSALVAIFIPPKMREF